MEGERINYKMKGNGNRGRLNYVKLQGSLVV